MRRLLANPSLAIGLTASALFALIGLVSLVWTPYPIAGIEIGQRFLGVSAAHWLGTDNLGRDMVSLLMAGTWTSFVVAALAVAIGRALGRPRDARLLEAAQAATQPYRIRTAARAFENLASGLLATAGTAVPVSRASSTSQAAVCQRSGYSARARS